MLSILASLINSLRIEVPLNSIFIKQKLIYFVSMQCIKFSIQHKIQKTIVLSGLKLHNHTNTFDKI